MKFKTKYNLVNHNQTGIEDFTKLEELQNKLNKHFEEKLKNPEYRKSHCMELSKN